MVLRTGDSGEGVKALQRGLNKLGEMLLVDGRFGASTLEALVAVRATLNCPGPPEADGPFLRALDEAPDPFPCLTAAGATFMAREEVSSASTYRRAHQSPCWPSAMHGITIGIGYDLLFVASPAAFLEDWGGLLPSLTLERLLPAIGTVGSRALLSTVADLVVPLSVAMTVFATRSLPRYLAQTRDHYPQVDDLSPARRTALVSLVHHTDGRPSVVADRREMRTIHDLLACGQQEPVAAEFEAMARLWDPSALPGVTRRRLAEAALWRSGFSRLQLD